MTELAPSAIVSVYATFGSEEEARRICRVAVEEGLAACANLLAPCRSIYRWQGRIEEAAEHVAILKTSAAAAPKLLARIEALHSYDVPAAVAWPVARTLPAYARWVGEETS